MEKYEIFNIGNSTPIIYVNNSNCRIAAALYSLVKLFASGM
jgi:hypothetical protein